MLDSFTLRCPAPEDGVPVSQLVANCPPLDTNSIYCNLLQCSHFSETSIAADMDGTLVGFVSGYFVPQKPNTLFVWQVAVADEARGKGLASKMILGILNRPICKDVTHIETTITENNAASWSLFRGITEKLSTGLEVSEMFNKNKHFLGTHDTEKLVRIGPISSAGS